MKKLFHSLTVLAAFLLSASMWATTIDIHLRDSDNNPLTDGGTATLQYNDGSWHTAANDGNGNFNITTAASSVTYKMSYNHASQQKVVATSITDVVFNTVTTTVSLEDSDGAPLGGGTFTHHQSNWSGSLPANVPIELLPGNHTFKMSFNHASQQMSNVAVAGASDEVPFVTVSTTVSLKDSDGNPLGGGTFTHHQSNWSGSLPANTPIELLPGNHTFKMSFNHASQQMSNVAVAGTSDEVPFVTVSTTVSLKDSDGNPLAGGTFTHHQSNWSGSLPANVPIELLPGNHTFKMSFNHASQQMSNVPVAGASDEVPFVTVTTTVALKDCGGTPLPDGSFAHHQSNWSGSLPANVPIELLPGNHTFKMSYNHGSQQLSNVAVPAAPSHEVLFTAKQINFTFPGTVQFHQSNWGTYSPGMHLLPGNYTFKFSIGSTSFQTQIPVGACISPTSYSGAVAILLLKDHNGDPLSGGKAIVQPNYPGGYSYHVSGATNSSGMLLYYGSGSGMMSFRMSYNGTSQTIVQDVDVNPIFMFQTAELRARMETCLGDPVDGGSVRFKNGAYKYWLNNNVAGNSQTGDAGPGEAAGEVFPGTYDVDMQFRHMQNTKTVVVSSPSTTTHFKTENVAISYPGSVKFKAAGGTYVSHFIQPSMELLAGNYEFIFDNTYTVPYTVGPACISTASTIINPVFVRLQTSTGTGIAGATIKYYKSGWQNVGATNAAGFVFINDLALSGNTKFRVEHAGLANEKWQDITASPVVIFETELVSMSLVESDGTTHLNGTAKYYGSGWKTFGSGTTPTTMELLPNNIKFRVEHGGLANEKWQNTASDPDVVFQTKQVTFDLLESDGVTSIAGATTKYYGSGWKTFGSGTTSTSMELLANNIKFRVEHGGLANEKWQDIGSDPNVIFQTKEVTFDLLESDGVTSISGATAKYYGSGWQTFGSGSTATTMELLPNNIKFRVEHAGLANEKYQDIGTDPNVVFQTIEVSFTLNNSLGSPIAGATAKYYGAGWQTFGSGSTATTMELLPNNIKFRVELGGLANEKYQDIGSDPDVVFATRLVNLQALTGAPRPAGTYTLKYYGAGWQTLGSGTFASANPASIGVEGWYQILPGNIKYRAETPCGTDEIWSAADLVTIYPCTYQPDGFSNDMDVDGKLENINGSSTALGTAEQQLSVFKFYPNPASTQVTIEAIGNVQIINTAGQIMYNGEAGTIDVSEWASGIYLVKTATHTKKLIVK